MIAAYHERIEHFEKKLNVKEKVEKNMPENLCFWQVLSDLGILDHFWKKTENSICYQK